MLEETKYFIWYSKSLFFNVSSKCIP